MQNFYNRKRRISGLLCSAKFILFPIAFLALHTVNAQTVTPDLTINNVNQSEGNSGPTTFTFTVSLSSPAGAGGVSFDIATADGTAQDDNPVSEDNDYVQQTLLGQTIPAGSSTYTFAVTVNGDVVVESGETFFVNVTNVTGANVTDGQGQGLIINDECTITADFFGNPSACNDNGTPNDASDDFFTQNINANFFNRPATGSLQIVPGGDAIGTYSIPVSSIIGNSHLFTSVQLKADGTPSVVQMNFTDLPGCIDADTGPTVQPCSVPITPDLTINNVSLDEGNSGPTTFTFTVNLSSPAGAGGVSFDIATADGTAQDDNPVSEDNDYVQQTLLGQTIPAGSSTYTFAVTVNGDVVVESGETFFVNVTNVTGANVTDGQGQGLIINDECTITADFFGNPSACNDNGTPNDASDDFFTQNINANFFNRPATGSLQIVPGGDAIGTYSIPVSSIIGNSHLFTSVQLKADGTPSVVQMNFTDLPGCIDGDTGPTVQPCSTPCVAPVITTPTVTQPTCATPTGTIVVNATGSGTLEYQLNAGTFQLLNTFSGLAPGSYNITVRLQSSPACLSTYSGNPVVLNAATGCCVAPVITTPTVTQPTCATPTGTIVVNATGSGTLEYQLNAGTFQLSNTFSGLAPGSYNISVRLQSSPACLSTYSGNPVVLNAATGCCVAPVITTPTVTQPTCTVPTGKIVVNATGSGTLQYRLNSGSWQNSKTFSGLAPGSYNISVRLKYNTSCVTNYSGNPVILNPATGCCVAPTVTAPTVTQPTCAVPTGAIVVNATGSGTLEYRLNSGSWQTSNTFSGIAPGSYDISVRLKYNTSCCTYYNGNPVVLNPATGCCVGPVITAPTVTQPTCEVPTGKIVVNATGSGTLQYRLNSGSWQTSKTFSGLAPGSYNITVRLKYNTSCYTSYSGNPVVLNAATGCCAAPVINAPTVTQPTCAVPTGKIVVNATCAGTMEYQLNSGSWQTSKTFSGLAPGSYNITVRLKYNTSCYTSYSGNPVVLNAATACGSVDPDKCYKIVNRKSGKALSIEYCSTSEYKEAEQQSSSNCMIWKFVQVQTGYYKIINVNSGKSLEVKYGSSSDYTNIVQGFYSGKSYEKWSLTATGAYFVVKAKHSGKAMSVKNASTSNGADVVQKGTGNNSNEQWSIVEVSCSNNEEERGVISKVPPVISSEEEEELSVIATPNPGISFFNLTFKSNDKTTPVNVRILDVNGKVISALQKVNISSTIRIAADKWAAGIYFAEVIQGGQRKVVKMIKMN